MPRAMAVALIVWFGLVATSITHGQQRTAVGSSTFGRQIEAYEVRPGYILNVSRDDRGRPQQYVVEKGSVAGHPAAAERFSERVVDELIETLTPPAVRGDTLEPGSAVVCFTTCYQSRTYENVTVTEGWLDGDPTRERTRIVFEFHWRDGSHP